jgi:hypothetical protein
MKPRPRLYGVLAEFDTPTALVAAARAATARGYRQLDAFSPFPIEELNHALPFKPTILPILVLIGGVIGGVGGYFMQWYAAVVGYPNDVGGRGLNTWPMFVPVTFELTILAAAFTAVLGMLALNGLPMPHHPLFEIERFALASHDRFFLCIQSLDPLFDEAGTKAFLESLSPKAVTEVEL